MIKSLQLNNKMRREVIRFALLPTFIDGKVIWLKYYKSIEICKYNADQDIMQYMPRYAWNQIKKEKI